MINQVTTVSKVPNDVWCETLQHLDLIELGRIAPVSQQFYQLVYGTLLWARFPDISETDRCCTRSIITKDEWQREGAQSIENRIADFIKKNPVPGKASYIKVIFPHAPASTIVWWMGDIGPAPENRKPITFDPSQVVGELYFVCGHEVRQSDGIAICPGTTNRRYMMEKGGSVLGVSAHDSHSQPKWYYGSYRQIANWDFLDGEPNAQSRLAEKAQARIEALEKADKSSLKTVRSVLNRFFSRERSNRR